MVFIFAINSYKFSPQLEITADSLAEDFWTSSTTPLRAAQAMDLGVCPVFIHLHTKPFETLPN